MFTIGHTIEFADNFGHLVLENVVETTGERPLRQRLLETLERMSPVGSGEDGLSPHLRNVHCSVKWREETCLHETAHQASNRPPFQIDFERTRGWPCAFAAFRDHLCSQLFASWRPSATTTQGEVDGMMHSKHFHG